MHKVEKGFSSYVGHTSVSYNPDSQPLSTFWPYIRWYLSVEVHIPEKYSNWLTNISFTIFPLTLCDGPGSCNHMVWLPSWGLNYEPLISESCSHNDGQPTPITSSTIKQLLVSPGNALLCLELSKWCTCIVKLSFSVMSNRWRCFLTCRVIFVDE